MLSVLILHAGLVHQPEIGLVDQARRAERMLVSFDAQLPVGDPAQLFVDQWKEAVERAGVARAELEQKIGDWSRVVIAGRHLF